MSANITAQDYVIWVKGSLNRWLGAGLSENGTTAPPYRGWVKEFQTLSAACTRNGDVDESTQDALIKANHQHDRYMNWVLESLNLGKQGSAIAADASAPAPAIAAIKKFQVANGLQPNGWVGAKTETALRKKGAGKPPATPASVVPTVLRPKWDGRSPHELAKFWSDQWLLDPWLAPLGSLLPPFNVIGRLYLRNFLTALWRPDADNEYVPSGRVTDFVNAGKREPAYGGIENNRLAWAFRTQYIQDALQTLIKDTKLIMVTEHWSYADGYNKFKQKLMELYKDIHDSLANIIFEVKACDLSSPDLNNQAVVFMGGWLYEKQEGGSNSILLLFPKHLHIRTHVDE